MKSTDVSFVIVSYNTADLIGDCLQSVQRVKDSATEPIVIDNASGDSSADLIRNLFPDVQLIVNATNRGFAAANNQAIPMCTGRYIFFLNPDARLQSPNLRPIISFMDENPRIALAGTRIVNLDGSDQESVSFHYPGQRHTCGELADLQGPIACVLGAGMIVRSDLLRSIDGFDEEFFLYGEDQDLCLRLRKLGYEIGYCDLLTVAHLGGQSERQSEYHEILRKKAASEYLFYKKHYEPRTITRIARGNLIQAGWRIFTIKLILPFKKNSRADMRKLIRYKIAYAQASATLRELEDGTYLKGIQPVPRRPAVP